MTLSARRFLTTLVCAVGLLGLAACAGDESEAKAPESSSSATAGDGADEAAILVEVEPDARYGTVVALRDAAIAAGLRCPRWKQDDVVDLAAESGACSGASVLATYTSQSDLEAQVDTNREIDAMMRDADIEPDPMLVGPNWTIVAPEAGDIQAVLGGTVDRN